MKQIEERRKRDNIKKQNEKNIKTLHKLREFETEEK